MNGTLEAKYLGDLCCKISINVCTCNINMSILASIHINKYLVVHACLQFQFQYSYIFSESRNIDIIEENFTNKICFFIGLRTLKPTRTRTLNRIPIRHGLTHFSSNQCVFANSFLRDNYQYTVKQNRTIYVVTIYSLKVCLQMAIRFITVIYQPI